MTRLVTLTAKRIASELERLRAADAADRHWRRRLRWLGVRCVAWYLSGIGLVACPLRTTNLPLPRGLFELGLYVAGLGPLITLLVFYFREHR